MDDKYLPWEDDELVFLDGDWEIERADTVGLYNYSVNGIQAARSVDGIQLVEWHMAELVSYSLLLPWENSGIEYIGETEIMRDVLDTESDTAERKYIIASGNKLLRVNRFYLVKNGMAKGDRSFLNKVAQKIVKSSKYNKACKPWVSDDILITAVPDNVKIERGSAEGKYRIKRGGMILNWSAERLVEEGYALNGYDVKLEELCSSSKASIKELKDGTRGFWLYDHPAAVKTLRDIAKLWSDLEKGYDGKLATKIMSHNRNIYVAISKSEELFDKFDTAFTSLDQDVEKLNGEIAMLGAVISVLDRYASASTISNVNDYNENKDKFNATRVRADLLRGSIPERAEQLKTELNAVLWSDDKDGVFPIDLLPQSLCELMREEYDKIVEFGSAFGERLDKLKSKADGYVGAVAATDGEYRSYTTKFTELDEKAQAKIKRREKLDRVLDNLGPERYKKPPLLKRKDKARRLRFLTGVKINGDGCGNYTVIDRFGGVTVTADELVAMGLAERY